MFAEFRGHDRFYQAGLEFRSRHRLAVRPGECGKRHFDFAEIPVRAGQKHQLETAVFIAGKPQVDLFRGTAAVTGFDLDHRGLRKDRVTAPGGGRAGGEEGVEPFLLLQEYFSGLQPLAAFDDAPDVFRETS
ncbi:hypothetical protein SDC9_105514 [bioreactor metagenome]|uniref:Uncharacterized protein n=1 Tax=bioreactor metagenome TaxID=1076179 RepID=A0A645B292_9ZZZZ